MEEYIDIYEQYFLKKPEINIIEFLKMSISDIKLNTID